jgi:hypothetical protein
MIPSPSEVGATKYSLPFKGRVREGRGINGGISNIFG